VTVTPVTSTLSTTPPRAHASIPEPSFLSIAASHPQPRAARPLRRYHFHAPGLVYIIVTLFIAIGAINSQNNLLFSALGLAIGGLLVSGLLSGGALMGLRLNRSAPTHLPLGQPLEITYQLRNSGRLVPAFGIHLMELSSHPELTAAPEVNWPAFFPPPRAFAVQVPPRGVADAVATVIPRRRGRLTFGPIYAWTTFPFGLVKKSVTLAIPQSTLIHPPILPLRSGLLRQLISRAPMGNNADRNPGMGDEFFGLREYVPGDSLRRIAWKRSARTGDLVVRQNAMPAPQRLWIVLRLVAPGSRVPAGASETSRLNERAIALAASLLSAASAAEIAVGLAIPGVAPVGDPMRAAAAGMAAPRLGRPHLERLLNELAMLDADTLHRGAAAGFPDAAARSGACAIIDAAGPDPSFGPPHALRFAASEAERMLEDSEVVRRTLALFDLAPALPPRRHWRTALRAFIRAAGGSA
jgi:uncharacterized protein (DUF58 family)